MYDFANIWHIICSILKQNTKIAVAIMESYNWCNLGVFGVFANVYQIIFCSKVFQTRYKDIHRHNRMLELRTQTYAL